MHSLARRCAMAPGVPVKPMLARICDGVADALRILGPGAILAGGPQLHRAFTYKGRTQALTRHSDRPTTP